MRSGFEENLLLSRRLRGYSVWTRSSAACIWMVLWISAKSSQIHCPELYQQALYHHSQWLLPGELRGLPLTCPCLSAIVVVKMMLCRRLSGYSAWTRSSAACISMALWTSVKTQQSSLSWDPPTSTIPSPSVMLSTPASVWTSGIDFALSLTTPKDSAKTLLTEVLL